MSQAALQRAGADMAQPEGGDQSPEAREAQRIAEGAAAFCLFGLRIALDEAAWRTPAPAPEDHPDWELADGAAGWLASEASPPQPANDTAHAFAPLKRRGLHLPAAMPSRFMRGVDWLLIAAGAEYAARWGAGSSLLGLSLGGAFAFVLAALALKAGLWLTETYRFSPAHARAERGLGGLALGAMLGVCASALFAPDARSAGALAAVLPLTAMLMAGAHVALMLWTRAAHRAGVFAETIAIIGANDAAARLAARAMKTGEARIVAIVDDRRTRAPAAIGPTPVSGSIQDLLAWEGLPHVDRIVIAVSQKAEARVRGIIDELRAAPNRVDLLLDHHTLALRAGADRLGGGALACVLGRPRNFTRAAIKRAQDLVIAGALLAMMALPMLAIAAAIRLDSKGPALYRQRRTGFNNRPITILKFRSMAHAPDAPITPVRKNDKRITRVGRWLRRYSLDELPQLINVLKGEMSLVGPRPHAIGMQATKRAYAEIVAEYAHRHRVKPGVTGWAQINGARGSVTSAAALRKRVKLDLDYVARASLWVDLQILAQTPRAMWRGK